MRKKALLEIRIKKSSLHVPLSLSQPFPDKTVTPPYKSVFYSFKKSDDYKTGQGLLFTEGDEPGSTTCNYMEGLGINERELILNPALLDSLYIDS